MNFASKLLSRLGMIPHPPKSLEKSLLSVSNLTRQTTLASHLELADHGERRRKGLLGRSELPHGCGLWIKPCEAVHTVGMQFPIDLVYLDRTYRIKKVRSAVGPWRISACLSAHSVLELPSGTIFKTQSRAGDRLAIASVTTLSHTIEGKDQPTPTEPAVKPALSQQHR